MLSLHKSVAYSGTRLSKLRRFRVYGFGGRSTGLLSWLRRWCKYRCSRNCCTRITLPCSVKPMTLTENAS